MQELMGMTYILRQALQQQSQDIINALHLIHNIKALTLEV